MLHLRCMAPARNVPIVFYETILWRVPISIGSSTAAHFRASPMHCHSGALIFLHDLEIYSHQIPYPTYPIKFCGRGGYAGKRIQILKADGMQGRRILQKTLALPIGRY
ncbi:hypothetical protein [Xanthomonas graminis]|uniref:hypothetical protein n=1 Tax=Xanthomonas graminis TaxID=3390026 RepID=UPI000B13CDE5|nr:hypothetical protein [Xanthomonas translucens]